jgi:7-cyano-7-deazaguanine synthase in queuosine biosynthesis
MCCELIGTIKDLLLIFTHAEDIHRYKDTRKRYIKQTGVIVNFAKKKSNLSFMH